MQTYGIFGSGSVNPDAARDLLATISDSDTKVIIGLTERHWTPSMKVVVEFIVDLLDLEYEVVVDESTMKVKELAPYLAGASRVHKVQRIPHKVVNLLSKVQDGYLVMLWNDESEEDMTALERATEKEIPVYNLSDGLDVLEFDDDPVLPALGLQNLLAVTKVKSRTQHESDTSDEEDEEGEYDEGVLIVMTKDELIELLEQTIINSLRRFRNGE